MQQSRPACGSPRVVFLTERWAAWETRAKIARERWVVVHSLSLLRPISTAGYVVLVKRGLQILREEHEQIQAEGDRLQREGDVLRRERWREWYRDFGEEW